MEYSIENNFIFIIYIYIFFAENKLLAVTVNISSFSDSEFNKNEANYARRSNTVPDKPSKQGYEASVDAARMRERSGRRACRRDEYSLRCSFRGNVQHVSWTDCHGRQQYWFSAAGTVLLANADSAVLTGHSNVVRSSANLGEDEARRSIAEETEDSVDLFINEVQWPKESRGPARVDAERFAQAETSIIVFSSIFQWQYIEIY